MTRLPTTHIKAKCLKQIQLEDRACITRGETVTFVVIELIGALRGSMELGTGILLSSVLLAGVALFGLTKDRWNWKKIVLYSAGISVMLVIAFVGLIYLNSQFKDTSSYEINLPIERQTKFLGINLGESKSDVVFKLGKPVKEKGDKLIYTDMTIMLTNNKVSHIVYEGERSWMPPLAGINAYEGLASLKKKLGEPSSELESKDLTTRIYNFKDKNIGVIMKKGEITGLVVFDGENKNGIRFDE